MRKIFIILLTLTIGCTLVSCSCSKKTPNSTPTTSEKDVGVEFPDEWN